MQKSELVNLLPFGSGLAHQRYLSAEQGIKVAYENECTHWYVDGSLFGEMVNDWNEERIHLVNNLVNQFGIKPIFHGNFKAPLASDVEQFREAAVDYVKKEIDISSALNAPIILHGGCIVEPKTVVIAKRKALDNYVKSVLELANYAKENEVDIYLENLSNYVNYRPFHYMFTHFEEYEYVFNLIKNDNVFFFLDIGHENICNGDPERVIRKFHKKIKGISFSNNDGIKDQHFGINRGTIDYHIISKAIFETKWHGLVAFEARDVSTKTAVQELLETAMLKN